MRGAGILLTALTLLSACAGERVAQAPPEGDHLQAVIPGFENIRSWGDEASSADLHLSEIQAQIADRVRREGTLPNAGQADVLVLSGGGSDGAYGAGLLNGWSDRGDRPEFSLVTGISTGALIAPYAFIGSSRDADLERLFTNTATDDLVIVQIFDLVFGNLLGVVDTSPLVATLDQALSPELIAEIAAEHNKGRRLLVGTTNLDAQRPMIWDIGSIAASNVPGSARLIRNILLASASIPGVFPPVEFVVDIDGQEYSEMHADGGVSRQLFFVPRGYSIPVEAQGKEARIKKGTIYLVRNTKLAPDYQPTRAAVVDIVARSVSTLIKFSAVADVGVIGAQAREDGFEVSVTAVPEDFDVPEQELFDPVYMRSLFDVGYNRALRGMPWTVIARPE